MKSDVLHIGFITTLSGRWPRELPEKRQAEYEAFLKTSGIIKDGKVITTGIVASNDMELREAIALFKKESADLVILLYGAFTGDDASTIIAEETRLPIVLWAPKEPPFDGGRLMANALVAATMNAASLKRLGHTYYVVYGSKEEAEPVKRISTILDAYRTVKKMRGTTLGLFGYRPTAFYNSAFDEGLIRRTFGIRMEETDLKIVFDKMETIESTMVSGDMKRAGETYKIENLPGGHLENHSKLYFALKELMNQQNYDFASLKCWPEMGSLRTTPCAVMGRLADEGNLIACEGDIDAALAMIMEHYITDQPAFITDMINIDEKENTLTFWHCGNPAPSLFENGPDCMSNHPLAGQGTAFYGSLKPGKVTIARFCNIGNTYKLFITRGEAIPTKRNTKGAMINVKISMPVEQFIYKLIDEGVPHHYSLVWEDIADAMIAASRLLGIEIIEL